MVSELKIGDVVCFKYLCSDSTIDRGIIIDKIVYDQSNDYKFIVHWFTAKQHYPYYFSNELQLILKENNK